MSSTGVKRNAYGRPRSRNEMMAFQNTTERCVDDVRNSFESSVVMPSRNSTLNISLRSVQGLSSSHHNLPSGFDSDILSLSMSLLIQSAASHFTVNRGTNSRPHVLHLVVYLLGSPREALPKKGDGEVNPWYRSLILMGLPAMAHFWLGQDMPMGFAMSISRPGKFASRSRSATRMWRFSRLEMAKGGFRVGDDRFAHCKSGNSPSLVIKDFRIVALLELATGVPPQPPTGFL